MNEEFFAAIELMAAEKHIPVDLLYEKVRNALIVAEKRNFGGKDDVVFCDIDPEAKTLRVYARKTVVEELEDPDTEILVDAAHQYDANAKAGDIIEIPLDTKKFGRIDAQKAKHSIRQGIRDAEHSLTLDVFSAHKQENISVKVLNVDTRNGNAIVEMVGTKAEATLPKNEQIPGEDLREGDLIKIYVVDIREPDPALKDSGKGPRIMISRSHPGFVRRLFETEVPEIASGTVEIKEVSREAGSRTKIAVWSENESVDAVGACIGPHGQRVGEVVEQLGGEKIDIVPYSPDPAEFIASALAPADVLHVEILSEEEKSCKVVVPDNQLSLAIGNKGQNARLAAKLTGWKIDINPESGFPETDEEPEDVPETDDLPETEDVPETDADVSEEPAEE